MDADCPCCAPPWAMHISYVQPLLYAGYTFGPFAGNRFQIRGYSFDGVYAGTFFDQGSSSPTGVGIYGLCCDRSNGNIYFGTVNDNTPRLFALNSAGAVLWVHSFNRLVDVHIEGVAVDNAGFVYAGQIAIHKFNAATGVEVTSGGWPYTPSGGRWSTKGICCDQVGNVYVCGGQQATVNQNLFALDSSGSLIWSGNYVGTHDTPAANRLFSSLAINGAGGQLVVTAENFGGGTYDSEFVFGAAGGTLSGSVVANGFPGLFASGYDSVMNYYTSGQNTLRKNGTQIYGFGGVSRQFVATGLAFENISTNAYWCGGYASGTGDKFKLAAFSTSGTKLWSVDHSSDQIQIHSIDTSLGRIGAFGP